jgi:hypothetical protein
MGVLLDVVLKPPLAVKKMHDRGWGRRGMRYSASEKLEIIRLVEQSHLPARRTLEMLGVSRATSSDRKTRSFRIELIESMALTFVSQPTCRH